VGQRPAGGDGSRRRPPASPLGEAAEGLVELAEWFTGLVGRQTVEVARAVDSGTFDADMAAATLARSAAIPLLGWGGLAVELTEAVSVLTEPLRHTQTIVSRTFAIPTHRGPPQPHLVVPQNPFVNGFDKKLEASVTIVPPEAVRRARQEPTPVVMGSLLLSPDESQFRLQAVDVPAACGGVYTGKVAVIALSEDAARSGPSFVDAWLVVP
jgi:hypothetical protein